MSITQRITRIGTDGKATVVTETLPPFMGLRLFFDNGDTQDTQSRCVTITDAKRYFITGVAQDYSNAKPNATRTVTDVQELCHHEGCKGSYEWSKNCGAAVCSDCDNHKGLARCQCGWAASGGDGRAELEELGETIDPEDGGFYC